MVHFATVRWIGFGASVCFIIATFVTLLTYFNVTVPPRPEYNIHDFPDDSSGKGLLQCVYLARLWDWRRALIPSQLAIEFFLVAGLLASIHPVYSLRKVYSQSSARPFLYNTMAYCFILAVTLNAFEFLENLGTEATGAQLAGIPQLDCPDRQALEIAYNLSEAQSIWILSLDYVFLCISFAFSAYLSFRHSILSAWHGVLGALNAVLCLSAFALEVAQVANASVFTAFGSVTVLWAGICLPAWLLWLSWALGADHFKLTTDRGEGGGGGAAVRQ